MNDGDRNAPLRPKDIPPPNADFETINEFGHTFEGYEYVASFRPDGEVMAFCSALGESVRAALTASEDDPAEFTLDDLRCALFVEMRQARLTSQWVDFPDDETLAYYHRLIECIRGRVATTTIPDVVVDPT